MQRKYKIKLNILIGGCALLVCPMTVSAVELNCTAYGQTSYYNASRTIIVPVDSLELSKDKLDVLLTSMNNYATCGGKAQPNYADAVRTRALTLSTALTNLGYQGYVISNGGPMVLSPTNLCLWPDSSCSIINGFDKTPLLNVKIGIKRAVNSGNWKAGATIDANTEIANMLTQFRYGLGSMSWGTTFNWSFVLKNNMVIPAYTCSVTQYDKSVTLPNIRRSDIVSHGTGRYPNAKKTFKFNLSCDEQTSVSVTFEGDTLSGTGTDSVLKNRLSGNDNVGIQLLFNDTTPVKMAEKITVAASAQSAELLSFNAYYYYKGGDISGGPVKANTTFTFEYQ